MNGRNGLKIFTYHKGVDGVIDFTDTTDNNLGVIGRVDDSSKHVMTRNTLHLLVNLPQFSDPASIDCYRVKKVVHNIHSQPSDTFTQGPWYVGLFNTSEGAQHLIESVEMVIQFDEVLGVLFDFLIEYSPSIRPVFE
jgi:hypothetical protein